MFKLGVFFTINSTCLALKLLALLATWLIFNIDNSRNIILEPNCRILDTIQCDLYDDCDVFHRVKNSKTFIKLMLVSIIDVVT